MNKGCSWLTMGAMAAVVVFAASPGRGADPKPAGTKKVALVELYTSQG
jgi:hypothetical protein